MEGFDRAEFAGDDAVRQSDCLNLLLGITGHAVDCQRDLELQSNFTVACVDDSRGNCLATMVPGLSPDELFDLSIGTALNFQEFYLGVFGRETRVGIGWTLWSQGGRLVTVLLLFLGVLMSFTGWLQGEAGRANRFGFGVAPEWYPRDAAKFLADLKPKGNMFSIRLKTAHYISYNDPNIKQFYDGRTQIFDRATLADYAALTSAITRGESSYDSKTVTDPETKKQVTIQGWKELADKHNITHFVFPFDTETLASPRILQLVMSPLRYKQLELIAVRDGFIVYGRIDKNPDQDQFKTMAIDNNTKYLKSEMEPTVSTDSLPVQTSLNGCGSGMKKCGMDTCPHCSTNMCLGSAQIARTLPWLDVCLD